MKSIIVDLDGTLALCEHRLHYIKQEPADWDGFFLACDRDAVNLPVALTVSALHNAGHRIVIFSGRGAIAELPTKIWLSRHNIRYSEIRMRPEGDFSPDAELKRRWLEEIGVENVLFTIDDRQAVVDMWRDMGLTCMQVAPGDF